MPKFALEKIEEIKGKLDFYYLIQDGENQYKEFCEQIVNDGNLASELRTIQVRMQEMAELRQPMPKTKCREITLKNESIKEYELKTKHLRVYLFHEEYKGRVVVLIGKKTTQSKDIRKFRQIKKVYINGRSHD